MISKIINHRTFPLEIAIILFGIVVIHQINHKHFKNLYGFFAMIFPQDSQVEIKVSPPITKENKRGCTNLALETIAVSPDKRVLYLAERSEHRIDQYDLKTDRIRYKLQVPDEPTGLVLSPDGQTLYVTCGGSMNALLMIDLDNRTIVKTIPTGVGARNPVIHPDGKTVYVLDQFADQMSVIDAQKGEVIRRIAVGREPIAAAISPDGSILIVANHLPEGASDHHESSTGVRSFHTKGVPIHLFLTQDLDTVTTLHVKPGSTGLKDVCITPDGRYAFVTHILANFQNRTFTVDRGWINKNALTVIDLQKHTIINTVLLDSLREGAANPWGMACSEDGQQLFVTLAGTHELMIVQIPEWIERLHSLPENGPLRMPEYENPPRNKYGEIRSSEITQSNVSRDFTFMKTYCRRIKLNGLGPRYIAVSGPHAYVTHYFSGTIDVLDLPLTKNSQPNAIVFESTEEVNPVRWGECLFHDASLCYQGWQSCSSCHPEGRTDGLNWDLLNDGTGNSKNTKSLLYSHQTPPVMSTGIRKNAEIAVRSGLQYILFANRPEPEEQAIDAYLKSLEPISRKTQSCEKRNLAIARGKQLFFSRETGCSSCHSGSYHTDLRSYDVGTKRDYDREDRFDTPSLVELWRTSPYLHDGRAENLEEVLTLYNREDRHGKTSQLTESEIHDLEDYLLSL